MATGTKEAMETATATATEEDNILLKIGKQGTLGSLFFLYRIAGSFILSL